MPQYLFEYNDEAGELDQFLVFDPSAPAITLTEIIANGNRMLNALISSEDIGIMSGDILKAYGSENMMKVSSIGEDFRIEPVYSKEVLTQINSATLLGPVLDPVSLNIKQTSNGFIYQGVLIGQESHIAFTQAIINATSTTTNLVNTPNVQLAIINHQIDNPQAIDNVTATRFTVSAYPELIDDAGSMKYCISPREAGSELLMQAYLFYYNNGTNIQHQVFQTHMLYSQSLSLGSMQVEIEGLGRYNQFD